MSFINLLDENLLLWNGFRNGDKGAFEQLVRLHYNDLFNYGSRFTGDEGFLKDCMQDLFLYLWKNRLTINETSFVKYYLFKSLRRKLKLEADRTRRANELAFSFFQCTDEAVSSVEKTMILEEGQAEQAAKIRLLITRLSKRQQEVVYLRFYGDADIAEIAEIMHLNRQSVYNLLHDALKQLRQLTAGSSFTSLQQTLVILLPVLLPQLLQKKF